MPSGKSAEVLGECRVFLLRFSGALYVNTNKKDIPIFSNSLWLQPLTFLLIFIASHIAFFHLNSFTAMHRVFPAPQRGLHYTAAVPCFIPLLIGTTPQPHAGPIPRFQLQHGTFGKNHHYPAASRVKCKASAALPCFLPIAFITVYRLALHGCAAAVNIL